MKQLTLNLNGGYTITVGKGILKDAGKYFNLDRRALIVTDSGVPEEYAKAVAGAAKCAKIFTVEAGEATKSIEVLGELLGAMLEFGLTRTDCVVAVGGGVVGDLSGFAAASYMRGIDFYNVPTTLLSQVDSSIGGKTAVNLGKVKNVVGAFHQPRGVLIDTDTLKTLSKRHYAAGMCEAIKMSLTSDEGLFSIFENEDINESNLEDVIVRALMIKKAVVEEDEKECGIRRILNLGHTLGHGIEAAEELSGMYHGECVALGMLPVVSEDIRARLVSVLKKFGLPTSYGGNLERALSFIEHDKKSEGSDISVILVEQIGKFVIQRMPISEFKKLVRERF